MLLVLLLVRNNEATERGLVRPDSESLSTLLGRGKETA